MTRIVKVVIFEAFILAVLLLLVLFLPSKEKIVQVCFRGSCFFVEVANTSAEQERGLMFKKNLEKNKGMLFVFKEDNNHPIWMKNTFIPLDIIWINDNKEVVFIKEDAQPCLKEPCEIINPDQNSRYVLEVNSGIAREINLKIGNHIVIHY